MLDIVRNNKKITQAFLILITLPFAFWGVESYVRDAGDDGAVATVAGVRISNPELQNALNEQQNRMRTQLGAQFDPALFETPQMRQAVLNSLVNQRLMLVHAQKSRMSIGDGQLAQFIASVPSLQEDGKFSKDRYAALLTAQGITSEVFEARLRQDMAMQQLAMPVMQAAIPGETSTARWLGGQLEQREVAEARLLPDAFAARVTLAADAAKTYYDSNPKLYEVPEQVRAEYVVLSKDALLGQATISDEDIKKRYEASIDRYKEPEQRRASHILIAVAKDAPEAEVTAAKVKAEGLLAQAKKVPAEFAKLAVQNSQDPGSAKAGGDLDWFPRGGMVKPFEDAAFALKQGEISGPVRSDFGFHIIHLTGIRAEQVKPLSELRPRIVAEYKAEVAAKQYAEAAELFGNMVYEQPDTLQPAADKWKLTLNRTDWVSKGGKLPPTVDNVKLANALFSDEAIKNKRNTESIELAPGVMVAARIVEHKPAAMLPFEAVKGAIEKRVIREEALKLAVKSGQEALARLEKGEAVDLKWSPTGVVTRLKPEGLPLESLRAIFKADAAKLPAYVGVTVAGSGYSLYRVSSVKSQMTGKGDQQAQMLAQQYAQVVAEEDFTAWMALLKESYPVEFKKSAPEQK